MIDIHSHILFDIDDGSRSISESVEILKNMSELGFTDVVLTPHYIVDSKYENTKNEKEFKLNLLKEELNKNNIDINLYLGNELFIDPSIVKRLDDNALSINNSKYILLELPMNGEYNNSYGIICGLIEKGYKVIMAHPERYLSVQNDISVLDELVDLGVLFQSNIGSLFGMYGKDAKKTVKKLLKEKYISFLSTDIHHKTYNYEFFEDINKKLKKYYNEKEIEDLLVNNAKCVLENKEF